MAEQGKDTLSILVDVRARLEELVKSQAEFVKLRQEVNSTGNMLRTGFGIDIARRGLDLLTNSTRQYVLQSFVMADQIEDQARNLQITNRAYQVFGNLLKDAGGDVAQLTQTVSTNNRSLVEARNVASAAAGAYRQLGLDVAELEALPFELRMERIARAIGRSTDRTAAFSSASQILGTRNLPTLLAVLREVEKGWNKAADAQERAGRIMSDPTIQRLAEARKELEKFQQRSTIFAGETIGGGMSFYDEFKRAFKEDRDGLARAVAATGAEANFMPWRLFNGNNALTRFLAGRVAPAQGTPGPEPDSGTVARDIELKERLVSAEYALANAQLHRQTVENDPNRTDFQKKEHMLQLLEEEIDLRTRLISATRAAPLDGENPQARDLRLRTLEEQNAQLRDQLRRLRYGTATFDRDQATRDNFDQFQQESGNLNLGGSARLGAMEWVTGLGSQGQQVSDLLQSTLGQTVSGISTGIRGWFTGARDFGSAMLGLVENVFGMALETIIQMGVQWLVTQALIKTGMVSTHAVGEGLRGARMAATAAEGAAATASMAPAAATASISSFGAAAALGVAALIAAMAIFGGFATGGYTGDGPIDRIAGVVHGQEGVLNAQAMRRLGVENLNALNAGRAISAGDAPSVISAEGGGGGFAPRIYMLMDRAAFVRAMQEDSGAWFQDMSSTFARKNA